MGANREKETSKSPIELLRGILVRVAYLSWVGKGTGTGSVRNAFWHTIFLEKYIEKYNFVRPTSLSQLCVHDVVNLYTLLTIDGEYVIL